MSVIFLAAKGIANLVTDGIRFEMNGNPKAFRKCQQRLESRPNVFL